MTKASEADRPTWRRKREEKRRDVSARRVDGHNTTLRREGLRRGTRGLADAEWNILKAAIGKLPADRQTAEFERLAKILRSVSDGLRS
ncbi:hypothetical protein ABZW10_32975 [Kitasatospora sp. NPDC004723]|uniref:hypothetical protein n=1 Tax=Kitasatospora sp. NPDC004723 TaxID=3154288 RepID=UPI0033A9BD71